MKVDLCTRGTFERLVVTGQDPTFGGDITEWRALATCWMEVQDVPPSRAEAVKLGLTVAINRTRVRYTHRPARDVTSAMRIRVSGTVERVLQIVAGPAVLGENEYDEVMCEAVA
jgi:SPP1 family predicted phage head-tail adaptor